MRTLASLCLALLLTVTFASPRPAAAASAPASLPEVAMAADCAEMGMAAQPAKAPQPTEKSSHVGCAMICAVGCVTLTAMAAPPIGQPVSWRPAFGRPPSSLEPPSAMPEAEDPPPRTIRL